MVEKNVSNISKDVHISDLSSVVKPFYNRLNQPPKVTIVSNKPTKVQESPLDARSPQEVLDYHGMYRDPSYYEENPDKMYMDLTQFDDYETCLNNINSMKETFNKLPIDVRARFNHDPSEVFKYINSSEFKIETLMDDKTLSNYKEIKAQQKYDSEYKAYLASDEYKQALANQQLMSEFNRRQFEAFKASKVSDPPLNT